MKVFKFPESKILEIKNLKLMKEYELCNVIEEGLFYDAKFFYP